MPCLRRPLPSPSVWHNGFMLPPPAFPPLPPPADLLAKRPPVTGDTPQARVTSAAVRLAGVSTTAGPGGGNLACAWMVNRVLRDALGKTYGQDPDTVGAVRQALLSDGAQVVPVDEAAAGDLAVATTPGGLRGAGGGTAHIGIYLTPHLILANSSRHRRFDGLWTPEAFARLYTFYEVIRLPTPPAANARRLDQQA